MQKRVDSALTFFIMECQFIVCHYLHTYLYLDAMQGEPGDYFGVFGVLPSLKYGISEIWGYNFQNVAV